MNAILEQIYRTGIVQTRDGEALPAFPTGVSRSLAEALYKLVYENKLRQTLEIGMAVGLSSLAICQGLQDSGGGHHVIIDPHQTTAWKSTGLFNLEKAGFTGLIEFYEKPSHVVLPELLEQGRTFQLIFIDGMHLFDYALVDFFYARLLVEVGGWICLDDLRYPAIRSAFNFITNNLKQFALVEQTPRYSLLQKVAVHDDRRWNHFEPF